MLNAVRAGLASVRVSVYSLLGLDGRVFSHLCSWKLHVYTFTNICNFGFDVHIHYS